MRDNTGRPNSASQPTPLTLIIKTPACTQRAAVYLLKGIEKMWCPASHGELMNCIQIHLKKRFQDCKKIHERSLIIIYDNSADLRIVTLFCISHATNEGLPKVTQWWMWAAHDKAHQFLSGVWAKKRVPQGGWHHTVPRHFCYREQPNT